VSKFLLDTNVVSELRKPKPHAGVLAWINGLHDDQLYLSATTMGESQAGVERTRSQDADKAREIEWWVDQLEDSYQVLPMDSKCFRVWARLMEGKPHHLMEDVMIAATARVHGLAIATRNERDFAQLNVEIINPFRLRP